MKSTATQSMEENSVGGRIKAWPDRTRSFYTDVRTEMKKVSTPSLKEVQATTLVVLITVALFGVYFWVVDLGMNAGVQWLMNYFTK